MADNLFMHHMSNPAVRSDQMLMAGYILQAFEHGGMPMHAAGYRELAAWAADELDTLDSGALQDIRFGVPRALREIIENLLSERRESEWHVGRMASLSAQSACQAVLQQFRAPPPT